MSRSRLPRLLALLAILMVPTIATNVLSRRSAPDSAVVRSDVANLRAATSTESAVIGKLHRGDSVKVLLRLDEWARVEVGGTRGYVHRSVIVP